MMNNCYRKIDLNPKVKKYVLDVLHRVDELVANDDPQANDGDYWAICEHNAAEIVSYLNFDTHKDSFRKLNSTFFQVIEKYPEFLEFLKKFQLHFYLGKPITGNWGIHKHGYASDTWTWTIFDEDTDNTTVGFHTPIIGAEKYGPISESYFYDHLENDREVTTNYSIPIKTGDMYTLNGWQWHSYHVPKINKPNIYLMYFKLNGNNIDDVINHLEQIDF